MQIRKKNSKKLIAILSILVSISILTLVVSYQIQQNSGLTTVTVSSTLSTDFPSANITPKPTPTETLITLPTVSSTPKSVNTACVYALVNDQTKRFLRRADKGMALPNGYEPEVVKLPLEYILQGWTEQYLIPEAANAAISVLNLIKHDRK